MATIRELVSKILFKSDPTGLKKVETNTKAAKRQMRAASRAAFQLKKDLRGIAVGFKTLIAVVVAGRIAKFFTADFATSTDEAIKFSKAVGVSLESYLGLTHAVKLSGGDIGDMNKALTQLAKRSLEVTQGNKMVAEQFGDIGVKVTDAHGKLKSSDQLLLEMADKFKAMPDGMKKTGLAMQLFGRTGAKLIPFFNEGAAGIKKLMAEAKRLGITLTEEQAKIAEDYNDEMLRAQSVLLGVRNTIALKVLPAITKNIRAFQLWATEGDNLKRALNRITIAAKALAAALLALIAVKVAKTYLILVGVLKKAYFWMQINGKAALLTASRYALIGGAILAIGLVIQDLYVLMKGGKSAIGELIQRFAPAAKIKPIIEGIKESVKALGKVAIWLGGILLKILGVAIKIVRAWWMEFGDDIIELGKALQELWAEIWPVMVDLARVFFDAMKAWWEALKELWVALKPSIMAIGEAFQEMWIAVKPGLKELWKAFKEIAGIVWDLVKAALPYIGKAIAGSLKMAIPVLKILIWMLTQGIKGTTLLIKAMKWAAGKIADAWRAAMKPITDIINAIVDKLEAAAALFLAITGKGEVATGLGGGIRAITTLGKPVAAVPAGQTTNQVTVGGVSVNVTGSADMTSAEFQAAVEAGTKKALQDSISETMAAFKPV